MEFKIQLPVVTMNVNIEEQTEDESKTVYLVVEDLDSLKINLSDSNVEDIKELFDRVFEYILLNKKLIEFKLKYEKSNLFIEVANDIVEYLNGEIIQSEDNFIKIIELENQYTPANEQAAATIVSNET